MRVPSAIPRVKFLNQREDAAMIVVQQLLEMFAALRPHGLFRLDGRAGGGEVLIDLPVEVVAIGDDDKRPVAGHLAHNLLREEDHAVTLAAALRVSEHAEAALILSDVAHGRDGIVDAEDLMILGDEFARAARGFDKQREVLDQVEKPIGLARATQHRLQTDDARLSLVINFLPVEKVIPLQSEAAQFALAAVRQNDEGVVPEDLRDGGLVVAQIVVEGGAQAAMRRFEFDENQRQAVDEADEIGAAFVHVARDPELRGEEEVVAGRVRPSR
jgi:hypothetical protein